MRNIILSLYDHTGLMVEPWAAAGYECHIIDIQHPHGAKSTAFPTGGSIHRHRVDLWVRDNVMRLAGQGDNVAFLFAFPVCTDMAVSGRGSWPAKAKKDPLFQEKAVERARWCAELGEAIGCPWMLENPRSRLATLWRPSDYRFDPYQYGGWIPEAEAAHPIWPDRIPPRDAYTKKTCLWTDPRFVMPPKKIVPPVSPGASPQYRLTGGMGEEGRRIRSATPRGFARAVFAVNAHASLR